MAEKEVITEDEQENSEIEEAEVDWETKFREARTHSREWERRAKANESAAKELEKLKDANKSELERAQERAAAAEAKLKSLQAEKDIAEWRQEVAKETGVPADILSGSTKEEIEDHAKLLAQYIKHDSAPYISSDGHKPKRTAKSSKEAFAEAIENLI